MNTKVILGFVAGIVVASGISYYLGHRSAAQYASVAAVDNRQNTVETPQPNRAVESPAPAESSAPPAESRQLAEPRRNSAPIPPAPRKQAPPATRVASASTPQQPAAASSVPPADNATAAPPPPAPVQTAAPPSADDASQSPRRTPAQPVESRVFRPDPAPAATAPRREPSTVTIQEGTTLAVRLGEALSTDRNRAGDEFTGTLDQPLIIGDMVIAERGARVEGRVVDSQKAGRVKGLAELSLELTKLHTADGQTVRIRTGAFTKEGPTSKKQDAEKVGAGAAIGAIIGAIAGGGKGAAIGAGVGGAAGGGAVAATRGKPVELPVETRLTFRIQEPVTITEKLN